MNFFEKELYKIIHPAYPDATYVGRCCYVNLGGVLRAKIRFDECGYADHYSSLKISILNTNNTKKCIVDNLVIWFKDALGRKKVSNPNFSEGIIPYIWEDGDSVDWYVYQPDYEDYMKLRESVIAYLGVFKESRNLSAKEFLESSGYQNT